MKKFKEWLVNNCVGIITFVLSTTGGSAMAIWKSITNNISALDWILISCLLIESIFILATAIWHSFSYRSYHYPISKIKPQYVVIEQTINYKVKRHKIKGGSTWRLNFSNSKKIHSCTNIDNIQGQFIWTGNKEVCLPKDKIEYQFNSVKKKGIWTFYQIHFTPSILKGDEKEIITEYEPIDDCTSSSPFVSVTTEEPTKKITFNLELKDTIAGDTVTFEEYRANGSSFPIRSEQVKIDKKGNVCYEVKNPKRYRYYMVSWEWKK